jgi:hypothetical protein
VSLPSRVPVFPLPNVVLFPHTDLPLHVFEPRYRQMVGEALPGDRLLGIVLLKPGWQADYFGSPDTYRVGCVGRMEDVVPLADGRYTLRLAGARKVEVLRYARLEPYRIAEIRPLPELEPDDRDPGVIDRKVRLLAAYTSLAAAIAGRATSPFTLDSGIPYVRLVNLACAHLGLEVEEKQRLLELHDVSERGRRVTARLESELQRVLRERMLRGGDDEPVH